jgi:putative ABC transport system permease protein
LLRDLLFEVDPFDPATLLAAILVLALSNLLPSLPPVRRATRVDPAVALQAQ